MTFRLAIPLAFLPALVLAQAQAPESVEALVKKLASGKFEERQAATKSLLDRPEAAPALRDALRSPDAETRKRAAEILDYFPVRELKIAVKEGRVERAIELITGWPAGKHEEDSWDAVRELTKIIMERHEKKGGEKFKVAVDRWKNSTPPVVTAKRITNATKAKFDHCYFLRAGELDLDRRQIKPGQLNNPFGEGYHFIVAAGSVRMLGAGGMGSQLIFAGGGIELGGGPDVHSSIFVSGGDITLNCEMANCVVIARGKVTHAGLCEANRIISGRSVTRTSTDPKNLIVENEANPLGFIRWSETKKEKAAPKSK
jgi:hypothetical protein